MKMWHVIAVAVIFYFIGAYWGTAAKTAVASVSSLV